MIVATFNINGIRQRFSVLERWLAERKPDVVCLQEIKCYDRDFPHRELRALGYGSIRHGQGPHHGVAILARDLEPLETRRELPGDPKDREARYIEAAIDGTLIGCLYSPNGNPQPGPKFEYKKRWFERLIAYANDLNVANVPTILAGDYNVVPTDDDIYNTRSWLKNALIQPAPRAQFARLVASGWSDTLLDFAGDRAPQYTFWSYFRDGWLRDAGWRIDHLLVNAPVRRRVESAYVDRDVRGFESASDHAPAILTLRPPN